MSTFPSTIDRHRFLESLMDWRRLMHANLPVNRKWINKTMKKTSRTQPCAAPSCWLAGWVQSAASELLYLLRMNFAVQLLELQSASELLSVCITVPLVNLKHGFFLWRPKKKSAATCAKDFNFFQTKTPKLPYFEENKQLKSHYLDHRFSHVFIV